MQVHEEAKKAFANLLDRAATSDQVKSVVLLLKRYESLFQLPSRIRQSIERGEGDQVRHTTLISSDFPCKLYKGS